MAHSTRELGAISGQSLGLGLGLVFGTLVNVQCWEFWCFPKAEFCEHLQQSALSQTSRREAARPGRTQPLTDNAFDLL